MSRARAPGAALLALAAGCANPTPEDFAAEFPAAICGWVEDCAFEGAPDPACEDRAAAFVAQAQGDSRCAWDAGQARQCLAALEGACSERAAVYYECKRAYRGDDCPRDLSTLLVPEGLGGG
jgi:hypothetical protein